MNYLKLIFLIFIILNITACSEKSYNNNSIELKENSRFSLFDDNDEIVFNIIKTHLENNSEILYKKINYPGNAKGHLFSVATPESTETRKKILFKVVEDYFYDSEAKYSLAAIIDDNYVELGRLNTVKFHYAGNAGISISTNSFVIQMKKRFPN